MEKRKYNIELYLQDWPTDEALQGHLINNIKHEIFGEEDVCYLFCDSKYRRLFWIQKIELYVHLYLSCMLYIWKFSLGSKIIDERYNAYLNKFRNEILKESILFHNQKKLIQNDFYKEIDSAVGYVFNVSTIVIDKLQFVYRVKLLEEKTKKYILEECDGNYPWNVSGCHDELNDYILYQCSNFYVTRFLDACHEVLTTITEDTGNKEYPFKMRLYDMLFSIVGEDINKENINNIIRKYQERCLLSTINDVLKQLDWKDMLSDETRELASRVFDNILAEYTTTEYIKDEFVFDDNIKDGIGKYSLLATYYWVEKNRYSKDVFRSNIGCFEKKELEKCVNKYVCDGITKYIELIIDGLIVTAEDKCKSLEEYDYSDWYRPGYSG